MKSDKPHGTDKPHGRNPRDPDEENGFLSIEQTRVEVLQETLATRETLAAVEYTGTAPAAPAGGWTRPDGSLAEEHHTLLQNLERLSHSLRGPEHSLERRSYNRPFPPPSRSRNS